MNKKRILLVEDEENLRETITFNLEMEGYEVIIAKDGKEALEKFRAMLFDLIVLDIMLPFINGIDVCKEIRKENRTVFILFLSAKNMGNERIEGLKAGADDYLTKPFNLEELLLRIEILIKRIPAKGKVEEDATFTFSHFTINFNTYQVSIKDKNSFNISKKEAMLLRMLTERRNEVVSREEILEKVWGYDAFPTERTIDNFILNFRKQFETDPKNPKYFLSVRSVGYKFIYTN